MSTETRVKVGEIIAHYDYTKVDVTDTVDKIEKVYSDHYGDLMVKLVEAMARVAALGGDEQ